MKQNYLKNDKKIKLYILFKKLLNFYLCKKIFSVCKNVTKRNKKTHTHRYKWLTNAKKSYQTTFTHVHLYLAKKKKKNSMKLPWESN